MTTGPLDDYLTRLEDELRQRGVDDPRTLSEARDHLLDAIEEGRQRGLTDDDATREAFERFGAPAIIAAHVLSQREHIMSAPAAFLQTVWLRKWWLLVPTVLTAVATSLFTHYFLPIRYQSESVVQVVSPRIPAEYMRSTDSRDTRERISTLRSTVLSRSRLEGVINEFNLYQSERAVTSIEQVVAQMRNDIDVRFAAADRAEAGGMHGFRVSFRSPDPQIAMTVTQRLTSMFVQENLRRREVEVESTKAFLETQIGDVRKRIVAYEKTLQALRRQSPGQPLSQADLLPYEVLQERYKELLLMSEHWRMAIGAERRQISEQFKVVDGARVPERPIGPNRASVNAGGTMAGLMLGLVAIGVRRRSSGRYS